MKSQNLWLRGFGVAFEQKKKKPFSRHAKPRPFAWRLAGNLLDFCTTRIIAEPLYNMKIPLLLIFFFLFSAIFYPQSLLEVASKDGSNLFAKEPVKIYLDNYKFKAREFYGYLGILKTDFPKNDTTELKELVMKAMDPDADLTEWTEKEIPNKIIVEPNEFVRPKVGLQKIKWTTKEEKKAIIKEIREYNKNNVMWPNFPLHLSRPVYSESGNYAIIGLINGGSTGKVILYKKAGEKWTEVVDLKSWVY